MFDPKAHLIQLPRRVKDPQTGHWTTRLEDYLEVKWRLVWFREKYPHGTLTTEAVLLDWPQGIAIIKATVADGEGGQATGTGTETRQGFEDFVEKAETRSIGRAMAALGIGTQFVGQDLTEGDHVADAPVATTNGQAMTPVTSTMVEGDGQGKQKLPTTLLVTPLLVTPNGDAPAPPLPPDTGEPTRLTQDQARELKKRAYAAFGYAEGSRKLRADLGFEVDEKLTLRHLVAHVTVDQAQTLMDSYAAILCQAVEADVPHFDPPAVTTTGEG